jgi:hypothetical protein
MDSEQSITLTTFELASSLVLSGYESMASQIINDIDKDGDLNKVNRMVEYTEGSLKLKGFWDENSPTLLASRLENLLHLLVQSKKKIRCIKGEHVLFMHLLDQNKILVQDIKGGNHRFSIKTLGRKTLIELLTNHIGLNNRDTNYKGELNALLFTEDLFNQMHYLNPNDMEQIISNKNLSNEIKTFVGDFINNDQSFDNISFMDMDYISDYIELKHTFFFLINEQFIWHLDYENIQEEKVYIIPNQINEYISRLTSSIYDFFSVIKI